MTYEAKTELQQPFKRRKVTEFSYSNRKLTGLLKHDVSPHVMNCNTECPGESVMETEPTLPVSQKAGSEMALRFINTLIVLLILKQLI
jgi:hypothetical protein